MSALIGKKQEYDHILQRFFSRNGYWPYCELKECTCSCREWLKTSTGKYNGKYIRGHHKNHRTGPKPKWEAEKVAEGVRRFYKDGGVSWRKDKVRVKDGSWKPKGEIKFPLCECGCGQRTTRIGNRFIRGHNPTKNNKGHIPWNKGLSLDDPRIEIQAAKQRKPKFRKFCKCGCKQRTSPGSNYISGHNGKGVKHSQERIDKRVQSTKETDLRRGTKRKGNWNPWSIGLTKETSLKLKETAKKQSKTMKKKFLDPEFTRKWFKDRSGLPWKDKEIEPSLCQCGCGEYAKAGAKYISGHYMRTLKGVPRSLETIAKIVKTKNSLVLKRRKLCGCGCGEYAKSGNRYINGHQSKGRVISPETLMRIRERSSANPNKLELRVQRWLDKLFPKEWKYVGDFQTFIGGKCPDFMNVNGQKKLIEVFGDYWHQDDDPQKRIDHFSEYGFETLVLWEGGINSNPKKAKEAIMDFHSC